jgi:hypothetical protein
MMNNCKVVLFNAAPRCGKDIAANWCSKVFGGQHKEFKETLFNIALSIAPMTESRWWEIYLNEDPNLPTKDTLLEELGELSQRQFLIRISENWVKPVFGKSYFGIKAAEGITQGNYFFSDSGFKEEAIPLIDKVGEENILLVKIYRPGHTFSGDSRNYLPEKLFKYNAWIENDGTLEDYKESLIHVVKGFLGDVKYDC